MSTSKFTMAKKLANVQSRLMATEIKQSSFEYILPLIFEECKKENLTFWFNMLSDACVLNLRDIEHENYELNIRYAYESIPVSADDVKNVEMNLLHNTFLLTHTSKQVSSASSDGVILDSDKPVPRHITKAIETIQRKGIPVTRESIQNHLPLNDMSTSARLECNKYLKEMGGVS